jgi:hypothetical protein
MEDREAPFLREGNLKRPSWVAYVQHGIIVPP